MTLSSEQKHQLNKLIDFRDEISNSLFHIERILKEYFPEEYDIAYQHYIPQISTALDNNDKWLPRGNYNLQYTINRLLDKSKESKDKGVYKYI
jgi:hypothetical protein